jgi:hypothetical protein
MWVMFPSEWTVQIPLVFIHKYCDLATREQSSSPNLEVGQAVHLKEKKKVLKLYFCTIAVALKEKNTGYFYLKQRAFLFVSFR